MKKAIALLLAAMMILSLAACGGENLEWADISLSTVLPQPESSKGEIYTDSSTKLWLDIFKVSEKQYKDYLDACRQKGFTVDSEESGGSYRTYNAFNQDGYKLELHYYDRKLSIELNAPMKMGQMQWPQNEISALLPKPKSTVGTINWEKSSGFFIYLGETTIDNFNAYANECAGKGFTVDYKKGDKFYNAKNANGYRLSLRYMGNNVMSIEINQPDNTSDAKSTPGTNNSSSKHISSITSSNKSAVSSSHQEWKQFLKDYEVWVDDYIEIIKKYKVNPTDMSILSDYTKMASKAADWSARADEIELELKDTQEALEYSAELLRIAAKLAEAAY